VQVQESFSLVTGGASGIGAETCRALLAAGRRVISLDLQSSSLLPSAVEQVEVDLSDPAAARAVAQELAARYRVTTVIHNAGAVREKPLEQVTAEDLATLSNLHVTAAVCLVQAALPAMQEAHSGRIVLVSSRAVLGLARRTAYAASKAAMLGLTRTWALELAVHGITVNAIAPGPIQGTRVFHDLIPADSPRLAGIVQSIPVRRLGQPADVARAILFFVAQEADFITGQTLFVCGGTSVGSIVY
jgi:3-oxoacyl-[acyl-carrier protein] reductase